MQSSETLEALVFQHRDIQAHSQAGNAIPTVSSLEDRSYNNFALSMNSEWHGHGV